MRSVGLCFWALAAAGAGVAYLLDHRSGEESQAAKWLFFISTGSFILGIPASL